jgi:diguanylate cyclase (GGDEF)-like protein
MLGISAAIACFGVLLIAVIAYAGWSGNQAAVHREQQLVENALNRSILNALNEQKSVAWWDDAVKNIRDDYIDLDFTDANFGFFLTETYSHDEVYILDSKDAPAYAFFGGERQSPASFARRAAELMPVVMEVKHGQPSRLLTRPDIFAQGQYKFLAGGGTNARWGGHLMSIGGRPAVVAAMTIVPNIDTSIGRPHPHLLVSITYMDDEFVSQIGQSLLLPDLKLAPVARHHDGVVSQAFVGDDGKALGELSWTTRRPGQVMLTVILPLVAFGILLAGFMSFNMLRRLKRASVELAVREAASRHEAKHDALSGLPNRRNFVERLDALLQEPGPDGLPLEIAAAYIDIDRFKDINDTMGHHAGDELIKAVAARLRGRLRPGDFLARFGGDEFAVLCAPMSAHEAAMLSSRIARAFATPFAIEGMDIHVTASMGIALGPEHGASADALMRHADIALYEAKAAGRDRAMLFNEDMSKSVQKRRDIEIDLRTAIANDELDMHYQPLISAKAGTMAGLEALLRWKHPVRGDISPAVFVPIAEDSGLMPALGELALRRVFADAVRWPDLQIAVNLSPVQFRHVDLPALLRSLVLEHKVAPERIVLEITEGVLLDAGERTRQTFEALRAMGFRTALDDFGTGYSSLAYLCNFKFDKIKIDRAFVHGAAKQDVAKTIVQAVVTLGRGLGMEIVAEGVETEMDAAAMRLFGCTELQGFFFSRPAPREAIDAMLVQSAVQPAEPARWLAG